MQQRRIERRPPPWKGGILTIGPLKRCKCCLISNYNHYLHLLKLECSTDTFLGLDPSSRKAAVIENLQSHGLAVHATEQSLLLQCCITSMIQSRHHILITLPLQALSTLHELDALFLQLELLNLSACGLREAICPEDIPRYEMVT